MRIGFATLVILIAYAFCAAAQETSVDPRLIGTWQNSGAGGMCKFFPPRINLTKDYALKTNPYTPTHGIIEGFEFISGNEMTYHQASPDGWDSCRFVRSDPGKEKPQP